MNGANDANEVERLRARVTELEAELTTAEAPPPSGTIHERQSVWWALSSAVLITLACLLAPLAVTSVWASTQVSDTDQYVQTVAPLAEDPAVQSAIAENVSRAVLDYIDVETLTTELLQTLAQGENVPPRIATTLPALAVPITSGIENFTRTQVSRAVASPQFAVVWERVNRLAHEQVVTLLEGNEGGAVSAQGDTITLNLGPVIQQVKERLVAEGFTLAERIPTVDRSFVLVQSEGITKAQGVYRLLNTLGTWLPFIAIAMLALGVFLARDRRRALLRGSLGVVGSMIVLGLVLAIGRSMYLDAVPPEVLPEPAAATVFDTLVRFLRTSLRATAVLGLVVALGAFMTGPAPAAVRARRFVEDGAGSLRGGAEAAGWNTGPVGAWTYAHKRGLRVSVLIAAGLVLVFWPSPTAVVVLLTALMCLLAFGVIEFLGRPPGPPAPEPRALPLGQRESPQGGSPATHG